MLDKKDRTVSYALTSAPKRAARHTNVEAKSSARALRVLPASPQQPLLQREKFESLSHRSERGAAGSSEEILRTPCAWRALAAHTAGADVCAQVWHIWHSFTLRRSISLSLQETINQAAKDEMSGNLVLSDEQTPYVHHKLHSAPKHNPLLRNPPSSWV